MTPIQLLKNERVIHSFKTALAVFLGLMLTSTFQTIPLDQWLVITIIVVMCAQINVGSMIQKSLMRLCGTIAGSLIAILTLVLFGSHTTSNTIVITLAALYFSYLSTGSSRISDAGTLGAVTTMIILVNPHPTILLGLHRTFEIILGLVIAGLISQFILPIHARTYLRRDQVDTLKKLRALYAENFLKKLTNPSMDDHFFMDEQIIKSLITQRKLAVDAAREPFAKKSFIVSRFADLLACEREILRAISFMHHAFVVSAENKKLFTSEHVLHDFHEKICVVFDALAKHIKTNRKKPLAIDIPSVQPLRDVIHADQSHFTQEDTTYSGAFLFCAEILVAQLKKLADKVII